MKIVSPKTNQKGILTGIAWNRLKRFGRKYEILCCKDNKTIYKYE